MKIEKSFVSLILYKSYCNLAAESKKTILSMGWWIVEPLLTMVIYYIVFAYFLNMKTENFVIYLLISLTFWQWFSKSVNSSMNAINDAGNIIGKVYINKLFFPITVFVTDIIKTTLVVVILLVVLNIAGFYINMEYLLLPFLFIVQSLFTLAVIFWVSLIIPFFPDLRIFIDLLLKGLMFASAIFYPIDILPDMVKEYMFLNPVAMLLDGYRNILMYDDISILSNISYYLWLALFSLLAIYSAKRFENKVSNTYIKVILK